jgi:class 3 adenylate cyclase
MRRRTFIIGVLSTSFIITGIILKFLYLAGANALMLLGVLIFILGFGSSFLVDRLSIETRRSYRIALIILFLSVSILLIGFILQVLQVEGGVLMGYTGVVSLIIFAVYFNRQVEGRNLRIRKDRQLAAILFTDIKGFTKMMGEDEYKGLEALETNRTIQKRMVRKYYGKWLKEIGDGTLSVFYTASEAVLCALEIQQLVKERGLAVRMGIHVSEVVFSDTDVFGDGVNVASRITDQADAGEICVTETVLHNVRNRENVLFEAMGKHELKNVGYALELYRLKT